MSRKREIEAAIAAYNDADDGLLLPSDAGRLLALMFPRDTIFQGGVKSLMARGFEERTVRKLQKKPDRCWVPVQGTAMAERYRRHLPPPPAAAEAAMRLGRREKVFGPGRQIPLDRNAKARIAVYACAWDRQHRQPGQPGRSMCRAAHVKGQQNPNSIAVSM